MFPVVPWHGVAERYREDRQSVPRRIREQTEVCVTLFVELVLTMLTNE